MTVSRILGVKIRTDGNLMSLDDLVIHRFHSNDLAKYFRDLAIYLSPYPRYLPIYVQYLSICQSIQLYLSQLYLSPST